jgi:hypothetical protein
MKKLLHKIMCLIGIHSKNTIGLSQYTFSRGMFVNCTRSQVIKQCVHCRKIDLPEWYDRDFRLLHPPVNVHGFGAKFEPDQFIIDAHPDIEKFRAENL